MSPSSEVNISGEMLDSLYQDYLKNPETLDASWVNFFRGFELGVGRSGGSGSSEEARVEAMINTYRRMGHLSADLNPLLPPPPLREELQPSYHGLDASAANTHFHPVNLGIGKDTATLQEITDFLRKTYCSRIGADYRELNDIVMILWLQTQMEKCQNSPTLRPDQKKRILQKLIEAEGFERFLQDRYLGQKRFSIEGLDAMIPCLDTIADECLEQGAEELNIGMAHRGRLNVLTNFMGKPHADLIKEFEGSDYNPHAIEGDVKYHKGFASEIETASNKKIRVYLSPNPSHLEAVNPVITGFARARQRLTADETRKKIVPILIHGDAAFVGQGVVAETLNFAQLQAYKTGGTIHIVANNQVGFTANPDETKSCDYVSDVAKLIRAPVFHVNADDPEAVAWVSMIAAGFRQRFNRDVVIDLIGYRRYGHNETDEPAFTQPLMYQTIKDHPTVLTLYSQKLAQEGSISNEEIQNKIKEFRAYMQESQNKVRAGDHKPTDKTPELLKYSTKSYLPTEEDYNKTYKTEVKKDKLQSLAQSITQAPAAFNTHPKVQKLFDSRREMLSGEGNIDWGLAEILAYASLADEGVHVRLSGQDCGRGTFSHRHANLRDIKTNESRSIFAEIKKAQVDVINSPLSELGCMGFEFGYSVADPKALVLWEAQFGDFANGAQILIDQFLVASEAKWKQTSGLTLLLPHGYEGQGPEHSSARPERFLQCSGNRNIQVINPTTPAQLFHALRRQIVRPFRKPLIVMTPKSLLRHPKVISAWKEFTDGGFITIVDDLFVKNRTKVKRAIFCTGKIYYDLLAMRESASVADIPLVRVEQLYPFDDAAAKEILSRMPALEEIVWAQEEPMNMGAWTTMRHRLEAAAGPKIKIRYEGRRGSGSTAEGSPKSHAAEQERIVKTSLGL